MRPFRVLVASASLLVSVSVLAHGPGAAPRYKVDEIVPPAQMQAPCLPGLFNIAVGATVNDFGLVSANYGCQTQFNLDTPDPELASVHGVFLGTTWFPSIQLDQTGVSAFTYGVNNRGQAFGGDTSDVSSAIWGVRWSVAGGSERIFDEPSCEGLNIGSTTAGNARYVVGWGLRSSPDFPTLCITTRWLIRDAAGVVTPGPLNGSAYDINGFDLAVGSVDNAAVRMHVPSGQIRVLHASTGSTNGAVAKDINDLGESAGYSFVYPSSDAICPRDTALRWDRAGSERVLPHLPGAVSSRAAAAGYDDDTVGDSGPGDYCSLDNSSNERATLWRGSRAIDLNDTIPRGLRITLVAASSINRHGQILATGFRNDEPQLLCPRLVFDPQTGTNHVESEPCPRLRVYLLSPGR